MGRSHTGLGALLLCFAVLVAFAIGGPSSGGGTARAAGDEPKYTLTILNGLPGPYSEGFSINSSGRVVGDSFGDTGPTSAFVWHLGANGVGVGQSLPLLVAGKNAFAYDVNNAGDIVGSNADKPVLWRQGTAIDLVAQSGFPGVRAFAINNNGEIAGWGGPTGGFIWNGTTANAIPLATYPTPPATAGTVPMDINDVDQTVGSSHSPFGERAFAASGGAITTFGSVLGSRNRALAYGVNALGEAVGEEFVACPTASSQCTPDPVPCPPTLNCPTSRVAHAFAFTQGPRVDLGTLDPVEMGNRSSARAVNDKGQIVGWSGVGCCELYDHAVTWDRDGTIHDLNDETAPNSGWLLSQALDINNQGQITGFAYQLPLTGDDSPHAFLLSPPCLPIPADQLLDSSGNPDPAVADNLPDADGDAIPDCWEKNGIQISKADESVLTVPLPGADPQHKDVFVEIDSMQGHRPLDAALGDVVTAFARAPVANPDGSSGVDLHAQVDDSAIPDVANLAFDLPRDPASFPVDFWSVKSGDPGTPCDGNFGAASDRTSPDCALILAAKHLVYHYALFGDGALDQTSRQPSSRGGISEEGGNDLNITLGSWSEESLADATGLRSVEARTFMHELGHNLGLDHGGDQIEPTSDDSTHTHNCKPNYLSVMNYTYADRIAGLDPNEPLDYSRAALPTLNQDLLDEAVGIGGPHDWQVLYGVGGVPRAAPADGPVDWNGDLSISADPLVGETDRMTSVGDCNLDFSVGRYVSGNTVVRHVGVAFDRQFVPSASAFTVTSSGAGLNVTSVALVGDAVRLVLGTSPASVHVVYARPAENALRLEDGTFAPSFAFDAEVRPQLRGYDDWAHLSFNFRAYMPSGFADGIGPIAHPHTPDVTATQVVALAQSSGGAPPTSTPPATPPSATPAATALPRADLSVHVDAERSLRVGNSVTYRITVSNSGPAKATSVSLRDVLPSIVNGTSAVPSQGSCSGTATVTCELGSIANGGLATVEVRATALQRGSGVNAVSTSAAENDPSIADNSDTRPILVHLPPMLVRAGNAFAPPLMLHRGRTAASIAATLSIDESATVNVRILDQTRGASLRLLAGSRFGAILTKQMHHSLSTSVGGTTTLVLHLFVQRRALAHGHRYVIVVRALDGNGDSSELRLPVRY